jgi:cytochrome c oxidase cbb3-type subunit 3
MSNALRSLVWAGVFGVLFSAVSFSRFLSDSESQSPSADAAQTGRAQFEQTCGFCHGADASGGAEGPNLMRSAVLRHDKGGDLISAVIRHGFPGKGMPPVPLSDSQIAAVVAFLHQRLEESDRTSPDQPRGYDLKLLLTGNAAAGKAFFYGAGNCSRCHSPSGDLKEIAKKYEPADLQARFLYPPDVPKTVTVTTRSGVQFSGQLFFHDQFSIAIKDGGGWYHSWPCSEVTYRIHDPLGGHLDLLYKYTDADIHNVFGYLETLK